MCDYARKQPEALAEKLVPRFLRYTAVYTTSDHHKEEITPSTPGQWDLARMLKDELLELGVADVELTDSCYVIGRLPATPGLEHLRTIGFLAHVDTSAEAPGKGVKAILVQNYDGGPIRLAGGIVLDPLLDPGLAAQQGKAIIHTDGTTLLGADDKAGIAEIMTAVEYLIGHPEIAHGPVEIIFSPDEEIGHGLKLLPAASLKSAACYTLDGGPLGEVESECFNAWAATVEFAGRSIHPGTARGALLNAVTMAAGFVSMLPRSESPEATDGRYGFYCPSEIHGVHESTTVELFIRDFDAATVERRLAALDAFAAAVEAQFPGGKVTVTKKKQYTNMRDSIDKNPEVLDILRQACGNLGIPVVEKPIRGGTDGSALTAMGIPTPNIFTGGRNFHSKSEWAAVEDMTTATALVLELCRLWGETK